MTTTTTRKPNKLVQAFSMTLDTIMGALTVVNTVTDAASDMANATKALTETANIYATDFRDTTLEELAIEREDRAFELQQVRAARSAALAAAKAAASKPAKATV